MKPLYLLMFLIFLAGSSFAQISPGDLSQAHSFLEGMSNCTKCHVLGEQVNNSKCLDCHFEIQQRVNSGRGYHSSSEVKGKNCWTCHSEHHGRNFRIINFDQGKFDHKKSGFPLTGKHIEIKCADCHKKDFMAEKVQKKKNSFVGLNTKCISCHYDYHLTTLGEQCNNCHNTTAFRPAPGFNHDKAAFILTGAHKTVQCLSCHNHEKRNGKDFQHFKGLSFSGCQNCHKDVHNGKFGNDCKNCHSTNSFHQIAVGNFDHNKTAFPLGGKHKGVLCNSCHKNNMTSKIKHDKCMDCHSDYHKGDFTVNGVAKDCSLCHNVNGFHPSDYSIAKHNDTRFALTGGHLAISCSSCHLKSKQWTFRFAEIKCISCHENIHGKELAEKFLPSSDCTGCHQTTAWSSISFNHNDTGFKLTGKHNKVNCRNCHYKKFNDTEAGFRFASLGNTCETCHKDVHAGQFADNNCSRCHTFNNWQPELFDHNKTRFSLEGAHKNLNCSSCHKKTDYNGISFIKYKLEDFKCAACHS